MLLFSTILTINKKLTKDKFIELVIKWNQGSPHADNVISDIVWKGEKNIKYGNEKLWLEIKEYRNENIIAVRFEKKEADGAVWDTDYIMNFNAMKMAIRLDRSFTEDALTIESKFSTPHFITLLIEEGYLQDDENFPITKRPVLINNNNINILVDIINGNIRYSLPVVYVSKTYYDGDPVNVEYLASRLKGVAHVLVEETNCLNLKLKTLCQNNNEYYGAIGIYYPNQAIGHQRYLYKSYTGSDKVLMEKVISAVIQYSNSHKVDPLYTWQGVSNALLKERLAYQIEERKEAERARREAIKEIFQLKDDFDKKQESIQKQALEKAQIETNILLDSFDEDLKKLQQQVEELTRENEKLQYENQGMKAKLDEKSIVPLLTMGDEDDFYQGEIKDLILSVLCDSLQRISQNTRRADVVKDIIDSNNYQKMSEKKAEDIKRILKNYNGMSSKLRQELKNLGFEITEDGKHYKLTYYGDERYFTVYGKTPSDTRSGKNNAAATIKIAF